MPDIVCRYACTGFDDATTICVGNSNGIRKTQLAILATISPT